MSNPSALAKAEPRGLQADPYSPDTFDRALQLAEIMHKSRLVPGAESKEQVLYLLMTGHELGLSPTQTVRGLYTFQGRVGMYADTMVALVRRSPECQAFRILESTDQRCTIEVQRRGDAPVRITWTRQMADQAGYSKRNPNWNTIPQTMLYHRCSAFICRQVFPDVIMGMQDREELTDALRPVAPIAAIQVESEVVTSVAQDADVPQAPAPEDSDPPAPQWFVDGMAAAQSGNRAALMAACKAALASGVAKADVDSFYKEANALLKGRAA